MTVLRHFRASGVVVAGYTIGLATYGAMGHPERTFEHVMARGSTVAVGVACLTLVVALLSGAACAPGWRRRMPACRAGGARAPAPDGERVRQGLVGEIYGVDDLLALGKAESMSWCGRRGRAQRYDGLVRRAGRRGRDPAARRRRQALATLGTAGAPGTGRPCAGRRRGGAFAARRILEDARGACAAAATAIQLPDAQAEAALLIGADRLLEQIDAYLEALAGLQALARPSAGTRGGIVPVRFHRDYRGRCAMACVPC